jgi:hypothetical protein
MATKAKEGPPYTSERPLEVISGVGRHVAGSILG